MDQDEEELYNEDHLRAIGEETNKHEYDTVCKFEKIFCHSNFTSNQLWVILKTFHFEF